MQLNCKLANIRIALEKRIRTDRSICRRSRRSICSPVRDDPNAFLDWDARDSRRQAAGRAGGQTGRKEGPSTHGLIDRLGGTIERNPSLFAFFFFRSRFAATAIDSKFLLSLPKQVRLNGGGDQLLRSTDLCS
jgi:hypothetical protein